jgi:spermidine synthase
LSTSEPSRAEPASGRFFPALLLLFVGSGCAALIYEVVWFELLRQVIGASSVSLAILLASFMAGMCIGSLGFSRWVPERWHPLKVYAALEVGIGVAGLALLLILPAVQFVYVSVFGYGMAGILLRATVCLLCVLPPTILMGATLPAVARWMEATRIGISRLGFLYMANLAGAVAGCLLAGFYLLRVYDMVFATFVAAALNALVALVSLALVRLAADYRPVSASAARPDREPIADSAKVSARVGVPAAEAEPRAAQEGLPAGGAGAVAAAAEASAFASGVDRRIVYLVIGLSGLTALGAQVIWTRLLGLLMGATVFTFSIILAVFLVGLGAGSSLGSALGRDLRRPGLALAWCQMLLVLAIPMAAYMINREIPFWYLNPEFYDSLLPRYQHDLLRALVAMLPATFLWGASFPLAMAAAVRGGDNADRIVGDTYAANTVGAIVGSLLFGMVLLPWLGTQSSQRYLTLLAGVAALFMFAHAGARRWGPIEMLGRGVLILGVTVLMSRAVVATEPGLIAYGRFVEEWGNVQAYHYVGEGRSTSVAVSDYEDGQTRSMHVGGKVVASNKPIDMRIERLLGHVPGLVHPDPKTVLVVGFGAGVTAGSFVNYPGVERIVICEIEPLVTAAAGYWFVEENYDVLNDPRTEVIYDDARHFMATTRETFDIITSDPIHPWVRGAASLYSVEYFDLVKRHLNPGGVVAQWVPLYETSVETVKSEMGTFFQAFPDGTVWNSDLHGDGYDVVMLGQLGPTTIDVTALQERLRANPEIARSLAEVDLYSAQAFLGQFLGQGPDLAGWLSDAEINRDRSLRLQYLAGLSLDRYDTRSIFEAIAAYRRYPDNIFVAPPDIEWQLRNGF